MFLLLALWLKHISLKGFYSQLCCWGHCPSTGHVLYVWTGLCVCLVVSMKPALCSFLFCLPSLSPRLPRTCHLARLTLGSSPPNVHMYALTHTRCKPPPNARPSSPRTRQPVSANQLNRLRPENNPMTDSPSGLPLSAQPAWIADSQGTGWTGYCRQEFTLGWAWRGWALSKDRRGNGDICRDGK